MSQLHLALGVSVLALNVLAALWGAVAWGRGSPSRVFWYLLRAAQATVIAQVGLGMALLADGGGAADGLHIAYGISPLVVALVSEAMRAGAAQRELDTVDDVHALEHEQQVMLARRVVVREMGIMTVGTLLIVTLALRALTTGGI